MTEFYQNMVDSESLGEQPFQDLERINPLPMNDLMKAFARPDTSISTPLCHFPPTSTRRESLIRPSRRHVEHFSIQDMIGQGTSRTSGGRWSDLLGRAHCN